VTGRARGTGAFRRGASAAAIALLVSIAIGSALMLVAGKSPGGVWAAMVTRTFGDPYQIGEWLYRATGLALTGLSVAIALDAGLFNIGAEGQLTAGVVACAATGAALPAGTPAVIAIPLCILAAAAAGAAVGALIGALRVYRGAHEVITSIMLDLIAAGVALWLGNVWLFEPGTTNSAPIAAGAELPRLPFAGSAANVSIVITTAAVAAVWWLRARTTWGLAWRAVGSAPEAARAAGIAVGRVQLLAMTGAGALAGLAATNLVMGHKHVFEQGLGSGTGLLGISVALLGRVHPVGVVVAALLLGFLSAGGLVVGDLIPKELMEMLQGVVLLSVAATSAWLRRRDREAGRA